MRTGGRGLLLACVAWISIAGAATAADELDLAALLRRPIIDPELPLAEVQRFTEERVRRELGKLKEWYAMRGVSFDPFEG